MGKKTKKKDTKVILKGGYVPCKIENIHEHLQEIHRGTYYKRGYDRNAFKKIGGDE
jgi:hypothetical protein